MPNRRIKSSDFVHRRYSELEGSLRLLLTILNPILFGAIDPFYHPSMLDVLESNEGVAAKGRPPLYGKTDVCPKQVFVAPDRRVARHRQNDAAECRPEQRRRRNEPSNKIAARDLQ